MRDANYHARRQPVIRAADELRAHVALAELAIHALAGRVVQRRALGWRAAGPGEGALDLDATRLRAGLYFIRFEAAGVKRIERLAIVR